MKTRYCHNSHPRFGVFSSWFHGDYQFEFVSGIEYEAKLKGVQIFYFTGRSLHSPYPYEYNHNVVFDTALDASLDGLVIMPVITHYSTNHQLNEFASRYSPLPLITINFKTTHGNAILTNNVQGFRRLLKHLIEDHGYRRFAFINGPETNFDAMERADIYKSMLHSYGLSFDPSFVMNGHFIYNSGKKAIATFFDDRKLKPGKDIEAIICANDLMARGALDELEARGIRVPSDIALTGFDGIRYAAFPIPSITTVRQHVFEIGRTAVSNLLAYDPEREDVVFDTELIIHSSCGCGSCGSKDNALYSYKAHPESRVIQQAALSPVDRTVLKSIIDVSGPRKDLEFFFFDIISSIDNLKLLKNMNEFDEWFAHNLPVFGIKSAYLFMYTDSPSFSRSVKLIAEYNLKKKKQANREKILPLYSLFDEMLSRNERMSYCILPLLYKDEQYGLLAMEVNVYSSIAYDVLGTQIGNSIKSLMLMEEVNTMNQKLEETNSMLLYANEQKTQFFINVAHETKTPLTLIQNYLERSMKRHASDPDLSIVKQNIDILLENMLNFLDAERLEKGTMSLSHDSFIDLSESARKKCTLFRPVAAKKNITISFHAEDDVVIKIDPWALDRILNNLLDNAIKYTQSGGKVWVRVKNTAGKAVLRVKDNGPGLPGDTISHLFEPYYQLSQKRSSKHGIGVGLSIVKKIIDDLGAAITVVNNKSGGACFTIDFIKSKEAENAKLLHNIPLTGPSPGILTGEDIAEEDISRDKASILIVDDNVQILNFLKVSLKKMYNVFLATDVPAALAKLKTMDRPELIISDIMMNGMDGHALLAALTGTDEYCDIPFIFLTAANNKDEEIRGLAGGAIDYIKKPFSLTELENKIQSIISLRKRMKKREIMNIRKGIDGLFSKIEGRANHKTGALFESLCTKYGISAREKEIITLILEGLLNKEIALRLHLSQRSVEYHITNIFKKVGISKRYDLFTLFRI